MKRFTSDIRWLLYIFPSLILCQDEPNWSATSLSSSSSAVDNEEDSESQSNMSVTFKPLPFPNVPWKVCDGANFPREMFAIKNNKMLYNHMKTRYSHCNYISKHLSIVTLDKTWDLSFLSTIFEVRGSVYIRIDYAQEIPLTKLHLIRGNRPLEYEGKKYSLYVRVFNWPPNSTSLLNMPLLSSIYMNDVYINIINGYSKFVNKINWHSILEVPDKQKLFIKSRTPNRTGGELCSLKCPLIKGKRYCWGPGEEMCQWVDKCDRSQCNGTRCFTEPESGFESEPESGCCHKNCIGGCGDISHRTCAACRFYRNGNDCVRRCPAFHLYHFCVKKCPKNYVKSGNYCLRRCDANTYLQGDNCMPCTRSKCAKVCRIDDIVKDVLKKKPELRTSVLNYKGKLSYTWRSIMIKLRHCTTLIGNINVNAAASKSWKMDEYLRPEDFQNLKNLRHINGYIYLLLKDYPQFKNLSFLSNLESIITSSRGIEIYMSKLEFLGLKNLKNVSVGRVVIGRNMELCYLERWKTLFPEASNKQSVGNKDSKRCKSNGKVCDQTCDPLRGCWGPGKSLCALCPQYQAGARCVPRCEKEKGYYTNGSSLQCGRCHETCRKTCSGPDANQCIDSDND